MQLIAGLNHEGATNCNQYPEPTPQRPTRTPQRRREGDPPGRTLIQVNGDDGTYASCEVFDPASREASNMSLVIVGAILALVVLMAALAGSPAARRWVIGMYTLAAALLAVIGYFYFLN